MHGYFFLVNDFKKIRIYNKNHISKQYLYYRINRFSGNYCPTEAIITKITPNWITLIVNQYMGSATMKHLKEFIYSIQVDQSTQLAHEEETK